jgi:hypothetical protein
MDRRVGGHLLEEDRSGGGAARMREENAEVAAQVAERDLEVPIELALGPVALELGTITDWAGKAAAMIRMAKDERGMEPPIG